MNSENIKNIIKNVKEKAQEQPKKFAVIGGGIVALIIALIVTFSLLGNTYKTPIKNKEKLINMKKGYSLETFADYGTNGFAEKEIKAILKSLKEMDPDYFEDYKDNSAEEKDEYKELYGLNYKVSFEIIDAEELEDKELRTCRDELRSISEGLSSYTEFFDDFDAGDWKDFAEENDISKSGAKKYISNIKALAKKLKKAEVSKGRKLNMLIKYTGSELDEPEEYNTVRTVVKVDGRWIDSGAFSEVVWELYRVRRYYNY